MFFKTAAFCAAILFAFSCSTTSYAYNCNYSLVESIPEGINFTNSNNSIELPLIKDELLRLVQEAKNSIDIAEFYFTLKCSDVVNQTMETCQPGEQLLAALIQAVKNNVQVRIAVNGKREKDLNVDLQELEQAGAQLKFVDFDALVGAGVLHTKMMLFDQDKFFLGSANMDWRSLTQVKEIGIVTSECSDLTADLRKIFGVYWLLGDKKHLPSHYPKSLSTKFNLNTPMQNVEMNGEVYDLYLSSSPLSFNPTGRTNDIDALLNVINSAKHYLCLSVMDYSPSFLYSKEKAYWPTIDNALRDAAITRGVKVRFILGYWIHTRPDILKHLRSLNELRDMKPHGGSIQVRLLKIPFTNSTQHLIPYSRVDHAKFMVSDVHAFIGTSNWSADYFVSTGGASLIVKSHSHHTSTPEIDFEEQEIAYLEGRMPLVETNTTIQQQLKTVFFRDWFSEYSHDMS